MSLSEPSSFCTICTKPADFELAGLLLSLSLYHPNATTYVMCDNPTKTYINEMSLQPKLNIKWVVTLDKYTGLNRKQMEMKKIWSEFQMSKADVLEHALKEQPDSLFLDSDQLITGKIDEINHTKSLGVSPHYMRKQTLDSFGIYNGGMLWVKNKNIPNDWKEFTKTSRFYDQASIEDLVKKYDHFKFSSNYNIQGWRRQLHHDGPVGFDKEMSLIEDRTLVAYQNKPIKTVHTHFRDKKHFSDFNQQIVQYLKMTKNYKLILVIFHIIYGCWKIQIPKQPMSGLHNHKNDSFRELCNLWNSNHKDINVETSSNSPYCIVNDTMILYDRPNDLWIGPDLQSGNILLLGNGSVSNLGKQIQQQFPHLVIKPWIFWPRRPVVLEKLLESCVRLTFDKRTIESILIGNFENKIQEKFRKNACDKWKKVLTELHIVSGSKPKFTQEEYLTKISKAKYGLCLRGFGEKCHREVELMAFGTVPVITSEVNVDSYIEPLKENMHFIRATPENFQNIIKDISAEKWDIMSKNCVEWFMRNVHSSQSWNTTISNVLYT